MGRALKFIGGVPALIVPDNPRALVSGPDRYEPELNRATAEFAQHYDTVILPARPRKPQDKAKVESGVQVVERWILARLRHRRFFSVAELDAAIRELLPALNTRPFKKLPGSRQEAFASARCAVPAAAAGCCLRHRRMEEGDGQHRLPRRIRRQLLQRAACAGSSGGRVAHHAPHGRSAGQGQAGGQPSAQPPQRRITPPWPNTCRRPIGRMPSGRPASCMTWAASVGPATAELVKRLLMEKRHPEQGYRACLGLMRLTRNHGRTRMEAACERALAVGAHRYRSVASILDKGLDRQPLVAPTSRTGFAGSRQCARSGLLPLTRKGIDVDGTNPAYPEGAAPAGHGQRLRGTAAPVRRWPSLSFDERFGLLVDREHTWRENRRLTRLLA